MTNSTRLGSLLILLAASTLVADGPRALPPGRLPNDVRLQPLKDLDGYFPFTPPASVEAWEARAAQVRRRILVSQGLWPLPTKTPLNAVHHGRIERDEYTVEKVYFESVPGFYVTGNLYRPRNVTGRVPGVLFAHGHWQDARLAEAGDAELLRELATGEERFLEGGRSRFQSLCVQLARMGCVVWQWDMLGNADAQQLSAALVHGFAKQRPEMNTTEDWGLFSPAAEAHLQSAMGLQTWNSIRSLDFLLSLPEVDPERVAMTGASGGGTQTMLLAAVDPRLKLSFPAVMVSTAMQGGCTCENASLLRVDTGNVEFAALFAPKPQGLTTANDWTKEMSTKGFPELKQLYTLLGAPQNVLLQRGEHFPHNYNAVSRSAFYNWVNRHFRLGLPEPVIERDYQRCTRAELTVWNDQHPAPSGGPDFERQLLRLWHEDTRRQLREAARQPEEIRTLLAQAFEIVIGRTIADAGQVVLFTRTVTPRPEGREHVGVLRNAWYQEEIPVVVLEPAGTSSGVVLWLSLLGKAALYRPDGALQPAVRQLLAGGQTVVGADLFLQGEFLADGQPVKETRRVKNPREAAAYTFGYNHSLFAQRVHDVLSSLALAQTLVPGKPVRLIALAGAGPWAAATLAVAPGAFEAAALDTAGFRFGNVLDLRSPEFLPGGAKYADLPGMLAIGLPRRLALAGESLDPEALLPRAATLYDPPRTLRPLPGEGEAQAEAAVRWIIGTSTP